jgi:hypothetical protein
MLTLEMEHVNGQNDLSKEGISLFSKMFLQTTVIIEEYDVW